MPNRSPISIRALFRVGGKSFFATDEHGLTRMPVDPTRPLKNKVATENTKISKEEQKWSLTQQGPGPACAGGPAAGMGPHLFFVKPRSGPCVLCGEFTFLTAKRYDITETRQPVFIRVHSCSSVVPILFLGSSPFQTPWFSRIQKRSKRFSASDGQR